MPELLKNIYTASFFDQLTSTVAELIPGFDKQVFLQRIYTPEWPHLELKQRMRHISIALIEVLPKDFTQALPYILAITEKARKTGTSNTLAYIFIPDLIEIKGLSHPELSIQALEKITSFISAEFAIRPFLIRHKEKMLAQLLKWSLHPDEHVRRLASEGCRPRLPWAMAVPYLKKEPQLILPVLNNLKADPSEYVRRSVANNLNDISKDHPELVIQVASQWIGKNPQTDGLLKHACRTLLKQGNELALELFGFDTKGSVTLSQLQLNKNIYNLGETLELHFTCQASSAMDARLQYVIDFARKTGKNSRKVFFLAEPKLEAGQVYAVRKKFKLQHYSTRQLHEGQHHISIMLNGEERAKAQFYLKTN